MNDATLMAAKSGNQSAINDLLIASQGYAAVVVRGYLGTKYQSKLDTEDVVQHVLIEVARDVATCQATNWKSYLGWLSYVSRNVVYKQVDKLKRVKRRADVAPVFSEEFDAAGNTATPDQYAQAEETRSMLLSLAAGVSDRALSVVKLMMDGMTSEQIANELDLPVGLVYGTAKRFKEKAMVAV